MLSASLECDKNTPTRVLAAAIYAKLERKFFDSTHSRMDLATAFRCNVSQMTKALTGVEYHSGPHHYKPKPMSSQKQATGEAETSGRPPPKKSKGASTTVQPIAEDTLESESSSSSSSSSDLPEGL